MIRVTLNLDSDGGTSAAKAIRAMADKIDEGHLFGDFRDSENQGKFDVEELCEFCDGTGEITQGADDNLITKKCFNCNGPDYDAMREGK